MSAQGCPELSSSYRARVSLLISRLGLGSTPVLRQIDTDFVNLSTLLCHLHPPVLSPLPQHASAPSAMYPRSVGFRHHLVLRGHLREDFQMGLKMSFSPTNPPCGFPLPCRKSSPGQMLSQFGPHFKLSLMPNGLLSPP